MPIMMTREETGRLIGSVGGDLQVRAFSRVYCGPCPLHEGDGISLSADVDGRPFVFMVGVVRSITSHTLGFRKSDSEMANGMAIGEGFSGSSGWYECFRSANGEVSESVFVTRILLDRLELKEGLDVAALGWRKLDLAPSKVEPSNKVGAVALGKPGDSSVIASLAPEDIEKFDSDLFGLPC